MGEIYEVRAKRSQKGMAPQEERLLRSGHFFLPYCWRVPAQVIPSSLFSTPKATQASQLHQKSTYHLIKQLV